MTSPLPGQRRRDAASTMTGTTFRALRTDAGLSVKRLAELLHCTVGTIHNIEAGTVPTIGHQMATLVTLVTYGPILRQVAHAQTRRVILEEAVMAQKNTT